jgi:putative chitinase
MSELNSSIGLGALRGRKPPAEDDEWMDESDDAAEGAHDDEEQEESPDESTAQASARFQDIRVGVRKRTADRCIIGIDIDLVLDAGDGDIEQPDEGDDEAEADDGEAGYDLDADDVEGMLEAPPARRMAPMAARAEPAQRVAAEPRTRPAGGLRFDRKKFFRAYNAVFEDLDRGQMAALHALLRAAEADPKLRSVQWLAYMLATVQHECAGTWRPIEEYGKGKGRPYGKPVVVTDPQGKRHRNVYYGRGFVQLTWKANYQRMGKLLKNRLLYNPKLALDPTVAYRIMSIGMRRGLFTGKKLADYIGGGKADYVNARRIINGLDQAQKLARNAAKLEKVLRSSAVRRPTGPVN